MNLNDFINHVFYSLCPHSLFQAFSDMLRANKTLQSLNLESNFVTGAGVQALVDALQDNDTLTEIKIDNQVTCMEMCAFSLVCIKQNNPGRVSGMV